MVVGRKNIFIDLIQKGRIVSLQQLRSTYRALAMKAHPDAVGSDVLLEKYLTLSSDYEMAKEMFTAQREGDQSPRQSKSINSRLAYFRTLSQLEVIDKPYSFHREENRERIVLLKKIAYDHFGKWRTDYCQEYRLAEKEYDSIKAEKPSGPYMKEALAINIGPIFHNITAYHMTGITFYRRQVKQNLEAIMKRLEDRSCLHLREYVKLLINDMENGPAVFEEVRNHYKMIGKGSRKNQQVDITNR
jgi:hypothetical protein